MQAGQRECQILDIAGKDDLEFDGIMRKVKTSGKVDEFEEHYEEVCEIKKKVDIPVAKSLRIAKKKAKKRSHEPGVDQEQNKKEEQVDEAAAVVEGKGHEQAIEKADATMLETEEQRTRTSRRRDESSAQEVPSAKKTATGAHAETLGTSGGSSDKADAQKAMANGLEVPVTPEHTPRAWRDGGTGIKVKHMVSMVNARVEASRHKSP